jgi:multidrug resistance protein, MATE family
MTTNEGVRAIALEYLPWAAALPFIGVWCFLFDGVFIGATRTIDMRNMMLLSFAVYLEALALLVPLLGNHGLWAAHSLFFVARAVTLWWAYGRLADEVGRALPGGRPFQGHFKA